MLKKVWASMLAVVILTALCLVPASAKSLEDYLIADFDFSTESYENQLDNMKFTDPMMMWEPLSLSRMKSWGL